jgi:hypothetical protein
MDYVEQSPRGGPGRGFDYSISYSMPTAEISALAIPEAAGFLDSYRGTNPMKLHTEYVGAVVLALALLGLYYARKNRYFWFFAGLALFALSISLGGNTPLYRLYYELLPATKRFRAPSISFFLVSMSLVVMAGLTHEALARVRESRADDEKAARRAAKAGAKARTEGDYALYMTAALMVLAVLMLFTSQVIPSPMGEATGWIRFSLFLGLVSFLLWNWVGGAISLALVLGGIFGGFGQIMMTAGLRYAPVSVLAPFDYLQIVWATGWGYLLFATFPSTGALLGAALIAASGCYVVWRERRMRRDVLPSPSEL